MLLTEKSLVRVCNKNIYYYKNKGYECSIGETIEINTQELPRYSRVKIESKCDNCGEVKSINYGDFFTSNIGGIYYCYKCKSNRMKKTNIERYGVENVFQLEEVKIKSKKTNLEKRGVEFATQSNDVKNKKIETNRKIYGKDYATQTEMVKEKIVNSCKEKFGVNYSFLNDDVKNKIKNKLINIYGQDNPMKSDIIKERASITRIKNLIKKFDIKNIINIENNIYEFKCDCGEDHTFKLSSILLYNRLKYKTKLCTICNPINSYNISGFQIELINFIENNYECEMSLNDRDVIKPNEIDIYLPQIELGFEFNGIYWHNELYKSKNYHINKTEQCEKLGIKLIHIYEDDWVYKKDIVKSRILNLLGKSNKLFARKCKIKEIDDNKIIREFLEKNHIQGFVGSKIKIGLFYENELVSLMIFGSFRKSMGQKKSENSYEMLRFCNKLNINVIGGASKLFKYFVDKYNPKKIISYADRSWSNGDLYRKLKFEFNGKTTPNYYYILDGHRNCRFNFRKDKLIKEGFDNNKSEHEIMLERKIYRIYDSGSLKFEYTRY